jgi:curli biogenesis system outer membrane secretion channel CsgG
MKYFYKIFAVLLTFAIMFSCVRSYPVVKHTAGFPPADSVFSRFAVLDFDYKGFNLTKSLADRAADQLSNELYMAMSFPVAERNIVKAAQKKYKSSNSSQLTLNEINRIGQDVRSEFLVLGTIRLLGSILDVHESPENEIEINIRFIDAQNGEVVCIAQEKRKSESSVEVLIHTSILRIIETIKMELK